MFGTCVTFFWLEYEKQRALETINKYIKDDNEYRWFISLWKILSKRKIALIRINKVFVNVTDFCGTYTYASFYDILNHKDMIGFDYAPQMVSKAYEAFCYHKAFV